MRQTEKESSDVAALDVVIPAGGSCGRQEQDARPRRELRQRDPI